MAVHGRYNARMTTSLGLVSTLPKDLNGLVHFEFEHRRDYAQQPAITMAVLIDLEADAKPLVITEQCEALGQLLANKMTKVDMSAIAARVDGQLLNLADPLALGTQTIPKPWGQEIWYTGIEARGVCTAAGVALPVLLDINRLLGIGGSETPVLLKILDPLPEEVRGDLYFELHLEKREVYVVTHVDPQAWPGGVGKIRWGFCEEKIADYPSEQAFKRAYLDVVSDYRAVRNQLDRAPESNDPDILEKEATLRTEMETFTATRDLQVGDVVHVHPLFPHSLQHGVRVIEFQTPHYERLILSFAQKVLTQDHWDTERAMERVSLRPPPVEDSDEVIADFAEFRVTRIEIASKEARSIAIQDYAIVIGVNGCASVNNQALEPEHAFYLTSLAGEARLTNDARSRAIVLIAVPA